MSEIGAENWTDRAVPDQLIRSLTHVIPPQPACQAAYEGDVRKLYFLLKNDPAHLNVQEVHTGDTPLIAACLQEDVLTAGLSDDHHPDAHPAARILHHGTANQQSLSV